MNKSLPESRASSSGRSHASENVENVDAAADPQEDSLPVDEIEDGSADQQEPLVDDSAAEQPSDDVVVDEQNANNDEAGQDEVQEETENQNEAAEQVAHHACGCLLPAKYQLNTRCCSVTCR